MRQRDDQEGTNMAVESLAQAFAITKFFYLEVETSVLEKDLLEPSGGG